MENETECKVGGRLTDAACGTVLRILKQALLDYTEGVFVCLGVALLTKITKTIKMPLQENASKGYTRIKRKRERSQEN